MPGRKKLAVRSTSWWLATHHGTPRQSTIAVSSDRADTVAGTVLQAEAVVAGRRGLLDTAATHPHPTRCGYADNPSNRR